jgi:MFS family permease
MATNTVESRPRGSRFRQRVATWGWGINPQFRGVLGAAFVSQLGTQVGFLAFPLIATVTLHASALEIAVLYSIGWLPYLVLFAPIGLLVDNARRVPLMIGADLARCLLLVLMPIAYFVGWLALWQLYLVALAVGVFGAVFDVADQALLPSIVKTPELLRANVLLETSNSTTRIVGPGAAGVVIALVGPPAALFVDAGSYVISAAMLGGVRASEAPFTPAAPGVPDESASRIDGLRYVFRHPVLRTLFLSKAIGNAGWAFVEALFVVYAVRVAHVPVALIGVIYLVGNVGLLVGARMARRITAWAGRKRSLSAGLALQLLGVAAMPLAHAGAAAAILAVALVLRAFGLVLYNVNQATARQMVSPPQLIGRISAAMRIGDVGVLPIGYLVGGALALVLPLRLVFTAAAALLLCALLTMTFSRMDNETQAPVE